MDANVTPAGALGRLQRAYADVVAALAASSMAAIVVIMAVQVYVRYFLGDSLIWAEEVCRYILIWMTFLFAGAAFQRGDIVAVELLTGALSPRVRALVVIPGYLVAVAFLLLVAYHGWQFAVQNRMQAAPAFDFIWQELFKRDSGISIFWIYVSVPVGCMLLAIHFLISAWRVACGTGAKSAAVHPAR